MRQILGEWTNIHKIMYLKTYLSAQVGLDTDVCESPQDCTCYTLYLTFLIRDIQLQPDVHSDVLLCSLICQTALESALEVMMHCGVFLFFFPLVQQKHTDWPAGCTIIKGANVFKGLAHDIQWVRVHNHCSRSKPDLSNISLIYT